MSNPIDRDNGSNGRTDQPGSEGSTPEPTRRDALRSIGGGALGAALIFGLPGGAAAASAGAALGDSTAAAPQSQSGTPPFRGVRVIEQSETLAGRLAGLLFADQGAEVFVDRGAPSPSTSTPAGLDDNYFDRGKIVLAAGSPTASADVVILDGDAPLSRAPHQIVLRVVAALPGDEAYGHLAANCSDDLLNPLVGFFTDMSVSGPTLGRPVIYTPLPLCSVYAGVNGAVALAAALVERERTGQGQEIFASRLAGGLSAIGALSLTSTGIPDYLAPIDVGGVPVGVSPEQIRAIAAEASASPARQLWLEQRLGPLAAPYRAADGRFVLPMAAPNRALTQQALRVMGLYDQALAAGMVNVSSYDPANIAYARSNLADSLALGFSLTSKLGDMLEAAFASWTAAGWEQFLSERGVPCTAVRTWKEWQNDPAAREARIFAPVKGTNDVQIGRSSWVASAQPYPDLEARRRADHLPPRTTAVPSGTGAKPSGRPLAGYKVLDLTNVVAGPNCARMFVELGATVYNVVPMAPNHSPTIVVTWAGESAVGKRSIILDVGKPAGMEILHRLAARSDFVVANSMDDQLERLGLDPASLARLNPAAIGLQITALRGERLGPRQHHKGYDPAQQGTTGIMMRFGQEGAPTYHGVASCVDYLCGYLGTFAGVTALFARERRRDGKGDWAETSLATAATLTQLLLQRTTEPATARGQYATGPDAGERVYHLADGWIFAQGPHDLSAELGSRTVADALAYLVGKGISAVPVQTCRQLADRARATPSTTVKFERREKDGWVTECFAPSWFAFGGVPTPRPNAASRIGTDGPAILAELGYGPDEAGRLFASGAVGRTEWEAA